MKKNIDEINIVILNYNDSETTLKLIESIHEYPNINKIIVVDNNSTDDSVEVIKNNFYYSNNTDLSHLFACLLTSDS